VIHLQASVNNDVKGSIPVTVVAPGQWEFEGLYTTLKDENPTAIYATSWQGVSGWWVHWRVVDTMTIRDTWDVILRSCWAGALAEEAGPQHDGWVGFDANNPIGAPAPHMSEEGTPLTSSAQAPDPCTYAAGPYSPQDAQAGAAGQAAISTIYLINAIEYQIDDTEESAKYPLEYINARWGRLDAIPRAGGGWTNTYSWRDHK
jgi:hypothetical protein